VHAAVPESGTVIDLCNNMIEELKPQSDTLLSRLRVENIPQRILTIRGHRVMLDVDLAKLYGVTTKRLNEAVRRNTARFPNDFMFQLAPGEVESLRSQFATSNGRGGRRYLPYAFTEQGVAMLSSVLNSKRSILVNVAIMRAFVRLRETLGAHKELARTLEDLERKYAAHDAQIKGIFDAIRALMDPPKTPRRRIGF
jgi:ORF6N domain